MRVVLSTSQERGPGLSGGDLGCPLGYLLFELVVRWNDGGVGDNAEGPATPRFSWSHVAWEYGCKNLLGDSNEPSSWQTMVLPLRAAVRIKRKFCYCPHHRNGNYYFYLSREN